MNSNIDLIEIFLDEKLEREYAVFIMLKHKFANSIIYNYSDHKLSGKIKYSRTFVKKHVGFFLRNGWAIKDGNHLYLISTRELLEKYGISGKARVKIAKDESVSKIVDSLRYEVYRNKQRQFNYTKEQVHNRINPSGPGATKRYKKALKHGVDCSREVEGDLMISLEKLSSLINRSPATAHRLIKQKGATKTSKRTFICRVSRNVDIPKGSFIYKAGLFKVECNRYVFD